MLLKTAATKRRKPSRIAAYQYRIPLPVQKVVVYGSGDSYPACPRCDCTLEREYVHFCDRCGQRLNWDYIDHAQVIIAPIE